MDEVGSPAVLFERPAEATRLLCRAFERHQDEIGPLFSGGQRHRLAECLEDELRQRFPHGTDGTLRSNVLLTYLVAGGYQTYARFAREAPANEHELVIDAIADASAAVAALVR